MIEIYTDGSGKSTPLGNGKYGFMAFSANELIKTAINEDAGLTNNEAEYRAVCFALGTYVDEDITIYSDSQLVVKQLNHEWGIKNPILRSLALLVWELCKERKVTFVWIPREQNKAGKMLG